MSQKPSHVHLVVGGTVLLCLGLAGLSVGVWGLAQIADDHDWVPVEAMVSRYETVPYEYTGRRSGGGTYPATGTRIQVWYTYEVDGRTYESSRYSRLEPWDDYTRSEDAAAQERLRVVESGVVTAWYDPNEPESAVLARAERAAPIAVTGVALLLLGIGGGMLAVRRRRRR